MTQDESFKNYHNYLLQRSWKSLVYRKIFLYPRIKRHLKGRLLDVGCGIGDFLSCWKESIGLDVNPYNVEYCNNNGLKAVLLQSEHYPFEAQTFDSIVLDNVLEHIAQPDSMMNEISRILSLSGTFIIGVPGIRGYAADDDHKIYYDEISLNSLLQKHGFSNICYFHTPFRSTYLNKKISLYGVYGVFRRKSDKGS